MLQPNGAQQLQQYVDCTFQKEIFQWNPRVYYFMGYGHSNAILLIGEHHCILIDTLDSDTRGQQLKQCIASITEKPVKTIIYTHGHPDHRGGSAAFTDTVEEIIAFAPKHPVLQHSERIQSILQLRGARQFGYSLSDKELLTQGLGPREGHSCQDGSYAILPPTTLYTEDKVVRTIDGIPIELVSAVGETDDQILIWLPEDRALCCGDNFYPCWPNLSAIRGGQYRDVAAWITSLDTIRSYPSAIVFPGHGYFIEGRSSIETTLKNYRDAIESVLFQTLDGMAQGKTAEELIQEVTLPETLRNLPYLKEHYGTIAWSVRGIFTGYAGWFDGNPTNLNRLSPFEEASKMLSLLGGSAPVLEHITQAMVKEQWQWAMQLCDLLLYSNTCLPQARQYKAACCLQLAQQETSANGRHYYQVSAQEFSKK